MTKPKSIITPEMLANMEMFAITHPGMKDLLDQCKVFYELSGSPKFFEDDADIDPEDYYGETDEPLYSDDDFADVQVVILNDDGTATIQNNSDYYFGREWKKTV